MVLVRGLVCNGEGLCVEAILCVWGGGFPCFMFSPLNKAEACISIIPGFPKSSSGFIH